jgi:hypothetical protein
MIFDALHADATIHWTDECTEIATNAFVFIYVGNAAVRRT